MESPAGGDVATLEMALVDAFGRHDIHATPLDQANARPTLRVMIEKWAPGSKAARHILGLWGISGFAEGEIVVNVTAVSENGEASIQGKAKSWLNGTWIWENDTDESLDDIAELIATTVATGLRWPERPTSGPQTGYPGSGP